MSNYRVRQVLALGPLPDRQLRLLIALATWLGDENRTCKVGFATLTQDMGTSADTAKRARRDARDAGRITYIPGRGRGNLTSWTVDCLPGKGVQRGDPFSDGVKGGQPTPEKGGNPPDKRVHYPCPDQHRNERELLLRAKSSSAPGLADPPDHPGRRPPGPAMEIALAAMRKATSNSKGARR